MASLITRPKARNNKIRYYYRNGSVIVDYTMYLLKPNHLGIPELYDMVSDDLSRLALPNSLHGVENVEVIACKQTEYLTTP